MSIPFSGPHGGDGARLATLLGVDRAAILDLSASLNPLCPDISPLVHRHLGNLGRYPDPEPASQALANAMGVDVNELLLTNGGAEAIALSCNELVRCHGGASVRPVDFSLYRRHLSVLREGGPRVRSNPGNPTGQLVDPASGRDDDGVEVGIWDEAFWPLATGKWTSGAHRNGAMVVGSLTKLFACPGLRLGYVLGNRDTIATLRARQPQWAVSSLAADVLPDLLEIAELDGWSAGIASRRNVLCHELANLGFAPIPGVNWVLARHPSKPGAQIRSELAYKKVLVRDCASFGLPEYVRIAIPRDEDSHRLFEALGRIDSPAL
jgi:histidinol-phosphate/aromatic aminotransferase/cobyric acid decarboxylase-like protein